MTRVLLALGANLGERDVTLEQSLAALTRLHAARIVLRSEWLETKPVGGPSGQPGFLNGAVLLDTSLAPNDLVHQLRKIESQLGRRRFTRWDARAIDLDILLYGFRTLSTPELQIPHPRMAFRRFVLDPACQIAGQMIHPPSGWTLAALCQHWQSPPRTVKVKSIDQALADWLTAELTGRFAGAEPIAETIEFVESGDARMVIQLGENSDDRGPVVHIASVDPQVILQEALAAIAAAWPE